MSSRNDKKKLTFIDQFARKYYCEHARLNSVGYDKRQAKRKMRRINKTTIDIGREEWYNDIESEVKSNV